MRLAVRHTSVFMVNSVIKLKALVLLTQRHKNGIDSLTLLSARKQKLKTIRQRKKVSCTLSKFDAVKRKV